MKLSVIIPVYNVESTLQRCMESVVATDLQEMEVILVDDGSPDGCPAICDEWAARDSRVRVVHQANAGLSAARNTGIDMATGTYLAFVDSDDYLSANTLRPLVETMEQHPDYDILEFPVCQHEGSPRESLLTFADTAYADVGHYWRQTRAYQHLYAWNKVYRASLFGQTRFPVGKLFEDVYTTPQLLAAAKVVATCSTGLYHYCHNPRGITSEADGAAWRMLLDAHTRIMAMPQLAECLDEEYFYHLTNIQIYTSELTGDEPTVPAVRFHSIKNAKTLLLNTIGLRNLCKLNRMFRKVVRRHS